MAKLARFMIVVFLLAACGRAVADDPVLKVTGAVTDPSAHLTLANLAAMPQVTLTETIPGASNPSVFEGPSLSAVLHKLGAQGKNLHVIALDDYTVNIDIPTIEKYQPILAIKRDGAYMTIETLGPFFIMWPYSENDEINNDSGWTWGAWQIVELQVQ